MASKLTKSHTNFRPSKYRVIIKSISTLSLLIRAPYFLSPIKIDPWIAQNLAFTPFIVQVPIPRRTSLMPIQIYHGIEAALSTLLAVAAISHAVHSWSRRFDRDSTGIYKFCSCFHTALLLVSAISEPATLATELPPIYAHTIDPD